MAFDTLKTLNASGSEMPLIALMITSDCLSEPICVVQAYEDQTLKDGDGVEHLFRACALTVNLPERNTSGFSDVNFAVSDSQGICMSYVSQVIGQNGTAQLWVLEYLPGETTPVYKLRLSVTNADITPTKAQFSAGWHDCLNRRWPTHRYTATKYKGLRYAT